MFYAGHKLRTPQCSGRGSALLPSLALPCQAPVRITQRSATCLASSNRRSNTRRAVYAAETGSAQGASRSGSDYDESAPAPPSSAQEAKQQLLDVAASTFRGADTTRMQRGAIEEAQLAAEAFSPPELPYEKLEGLWKLVYTTAVDVTPILGLERRFPGPDFLSPRVGDIYQRFSSPADGSVQNIIQLSVPGLEDRRGVTLTVTATYEVRSGRRLALKFEEAEVGQLRISSALETLLAPAILPRGSLQHRLLLGIKEASLRVPLRGSGPAAGPSPAASGFATYLLTYLDEDMLIGRAVGSGGSFVFTRQAEAAQRSQHGH